VQKVPNELMMRQLLPASGFEQLQMSSESQKSLLGTAAAAAKAAAAKAAAVAAKDCAGIA